MLSVALLAGVDAFVKVVGQDMHPFQVVFFRNLFGAITIAPFILRGGLHRLRTNRLGFHAARGAVHVGSMFCWFTALTLIPLAEATALSFMLPMWASIGAIIFLGEPNRLNRWISIAVGLVGMLIIIRPGAVPISLGIVLVIIGSMCAAAHKVMTKSLARTDTPLTIIAYMSFFLTIFSLIPALFVWTTPSLLALGIFAFMGILGTWAHYLMTAAYRDGELTAVEPVTFARLIWAAIFGYIFFTEVPEIWTWAGSAVIVAGAIYLARIEALQSRAARAAASQ